MTHGSTIFLGTIFFIASLFGACSAGADDLIRSTQHGEVQGMSVPYESNAWLGLPYAKAPVGALRWRAPRPPQSWSGVRDASRFGSVCSQGEVSLKSTRYAVSMEISEDVEDGSEDCLYLNVWAPRDLEVGEQLPVMVWIHGGSHTSGAGSDYNGARLASTGRVIVVTINYRLGFFGWFRNQALYDEGDTTEDQSGNYGTLDQIAALEWVRNNIAAFGGDPELVTIFGESAGGWDIFALLGSPKAKGLFDRAISQSGPRPQTWSLAQSENYWDDKVAGMPHSTSELLVQIFLDENLAKDVEAARQIISETPRDQIGQLLRDKSYSELNSAFSNLHKRFLSTHIVQDYASFVPVRDGVVMPKEELLELFRQNGSDGVPVIFGSTKEEERLMILAGHLEEPSGGLPALKDEGWFTVLNEYLSAFWQVYGANIPALAISEAQPGEGNVFTYRFDWDETSNPFYEGRLGAIHFLDVPFVFGVMDVSQVWNRTFYTNIIPDSSRPSYRTLSDQMISYWTEFAYNGAPGRGRDGTLPEWRAWNSNIQAASPEVMLLDSASDGGLRMSSDVETKEHLLAELVDDPRVVELEQRCRLYRSFVNRINRISLEDYQAIEDGACARQFPLVVGE